MFCEKKPAVLSKPTQQKPSLLLSPTKCRHLCVFSWSLAQIETGFSWDIQFPLELIVRLHQRQGECCCAAQQCWEKRRLLSRQRHQPMHTTRHVLLGTDFKEEEANEPVTCTCEQSLPRLAVLHQMITTDFYRRRVFPFLWLPKMGSEQNDAGMIENIVMDGLCCPNKCNQFHCSGGPRPLNFFTSTFSKICVRNGGGLRGQNGSQDPPPPKAQLGIFGSAPPSNILDTPLMVEVLCHHLASTKWSVPRHFSTVEFPFLITKALTACAHFLFIKFHQRRMRSVSALVGSSNSSWMFFQSLRAEATIFAIFSQDSHQLWWRPKISLPCISLRSSWGDTMLINACCAFSMSETIPEPVLCNGWWVEEGGGRVVDAIVVLSSRFPNT